MTGNLKEMKKLNLLLLLIGALAMSCHQKHATEQSNKITDDSSVANGKYITVVREGDKLRPGESMSDIKDNPNIAQSDIAAMSKAQSKEIQYVSAGEKVRIEEKASTPKE